MSIMVCFYWILKLQAQFMAGGYAEALVSADNAKALLWASAVQIHLLDYFYYAGLRRQHRMRTLLPTSSKHGANF
jgi:hypothetical protein